jgi:anaerobic magnesium-protoporphyrin IX monomethyl ester cyclase
MRQAGFRYVFLGIENILDEDLGFLKATAKNSKREHGSRAGNATLTAIEALHRQGMYVVGGLIIGNPGDTRESIEVNLEFARRYVDWPYIQHPTPYPATPMTRQLRERGLVINERMEEYDGTTAVVRSEHLTAEEIEFLRWRKERWMKLRHLPAALVRSPWFVLRNGLAMFRHTFRGCGLKTLLGWEDEHLAFARYRAFRQAERVYQGNPMKHSVSPLRPRAMAALGMIAAAGLVGTSAPVFAQTVTCGVGERVESENANTPGTIVEVGTERPHVGWYQAS